MMKHAIKRMLKEPPLKTPLTPEFRLLLGCSLLLKGSRESPCSTRIAALCSAPDHGAIDWTIFLGLVDRHRVPTLVCASMSHHHAWRCVPEQIGAQLKERDRQSRMDALKHSSELVRLARLFEANGIELLPLKGPALSAKLYGDPGLRQSKDLDLMVKPEDMDRADRILLNEGYQRTFPDFDLTTKQKRIFQSFRQHYSYRHSRRSVFLELHWRISLWRPEHVLELWSHSRPIQWSGACFRELSEEMLLLLLCDHGSYHQWFRIKWLSDFATLLAGRSNKSLTHLIETAGRLDLRRSLAQGALLVHWLYEMALEEPLWILITEEEKAIHLAGRSLRAMLMSEKEHDAAPLHDKWKRELYFLGMRTTLPYRYFLQRLLMDMEAWKLLPLHDRTFWLYYVLRLPFWLRRHYM